VVKIGSGAPLDVVLRIMARTRSLLLSTAVYVDSKVRIVRKATVLFTIVGFLAVAVWASCPARPICPTHHVEMDKTSSNCDDAGDSTVVYRCPVGGETWTLYCNGGG
jgi:hypothetical protein